MIEKILGVIPVQKVDNYKENQQSSRDTLKKQKDFTFETILSQTLSAVPQDTAAYHLELHRK